MLALLRLSAAVALTALVACGASTEPDQSTTPPPSMKFNLLLTTDSATAPDMACEWLYCYKNVPDSGTLTARLFFGPLTSDLSSDPDNVGTVLRAYSGVSFQNMDGKAWVNSDSTVTVSVGGTIDTDYEGYAFVGKITDGRYAGRWRESTDPHGSGKSGTFVTVPDSA